jgi:hypothetical protein|mmetsp:Transcript_18692/g.20324  ORF Transcript_18692/g.20324 Transcript_18692/m.20324 type:complete len:140 (-) Transcript_18692:140-559(-)
MQSVYVLVLCLFVIFCLTPNIYAENFSQRRRRTKELEEKINKLDDATKQRIYAMKAAGMPREAIAEKIAYTAGGKGTAKRIVDALHDEAPKRQQAKPKPQATPKKTTNTAPTSSTANKKPATNSNTGKAPTNVNVGKKK